MTTSFDILKFDTRTLSESGVDMPISHPRSGAPMLRGDGKPVTITLLGPNSETFRRMQREISTRRADFANRGVKMADEDYERDRFDMLVAVTKGWSFDSLGGEPFAFTPDNVRRFWADGRWQWLQVAAWQFCQQDGNFLPSS